MHCSLQYWRGFALFLEVDQAYQESLSPTLLYATYSLWQVLLYQPPSWHRSTVATPPQGSLSGKGTCSLSLAWFALCGLVVVVVVVVSVVEEQTETELLRRRLLKLRLLIQLRLDFGTVMEEELQS
ncbi:hypothetical protein RIF29_29218 [Crotalaria pallida]|uniref:Uncharacterized protein n=1 Tax=Crotalaria pallida TaxID=3830 RepID=A0AAN9EE47_CROPI